MKKKNKKSSAITALLAKYIYGTKNFFVLSITLYTKTVKLLQTF